MLTALKAALRYAQHGYPVLRVWPLNDKHECTCSNGKHCETPGKHPVDNAWQKKATTDKERIERLWKDGDYHVGIMPPEHHCILDIDPRNGGVKTFKSLLDPKTVEHTVIQNSGGGGVHLVFKGEPDGQLGKGIDVKRHGRGYVVAYPAGHVSGGKYSWKHAPWDTEPLKLPEALRSKAHTKDDKPQQQITDVPIERVQAALEFVDPDDYEWWISVGQALKYNYGDDGYDAYLKWTEKSDKFQDESYVEDKWKTFDRNRDRPLVTIRSIISKARHKGFRPLATEFKDDIWSMASVEGMQENEAPEIEWAFENCIPCGKVTLIAGAGGSSKSFLTLTLAICMTLDVSFGPFKPGKPGKALLLVAEEDREDIHRRMRAIGAARMHDKDQYHAINENLGVLTVRGLDWRLVYHDDAGDVQETDRVDYLIEQIKSIGDVRLVVLDPLVAFNGAKENDNAEMARLMFTLDRIARETGAAIVVVHHVSKGGQVMSLNEATQAAVRGASALVDNARSALLLTRMPRNDAAMFNITMDEAGKHVVCRFIKSNYGSHMDDAVFKVEAGGALRHAPEIKRQFNTSAEANRTMAKGDTESRRMQIAALIADTSGDVTQAVLEEKLGISQQAISKHIRYMTEHREIEKYGTSSDTYWQITKKGRKVYELNPDKIGSKNEDDNDIY